MLIECGPDMDPYTGFYECPDGQDYPGDLLCDVCPKKNVYEEWDEDLCRT